VPLVTYLISNSLLIVRHIAKSISGLLSFKDKSRQVSIFKGLAKCRRV
jgi:hypothetical protein